MCADKPHDCTLAEGENLLIVKRTRMSINKTSILRTGIGATIALLLVFTATGCGEEDEKNTPLPENEKTEVIEPIQEKEYLTDPLVLPAPSTKGTLSVEAAMQARKVHTKFVDEQPISLEDFSQLLWAMQGITEEATTEETTDDTEETTDDTKEADNTTTERTVSSAKSVYPLEIYVYVHSVNTLEKGFYHYIPDGHKLGKLKDGDFRDDIVKTTYSETAPEKAPITFIIAGDYEKMREVYAQGDTAEKNVHLEAGNAAQNLYLQVESLELGMIAINGFDPKQVQRLIELPNRETPMLLIPVGKKDLEEEPAEETTE